MFSNTSSDFISDMGVIGQRDYDWWYIGNKIQNLHLQEYSLKNTLSSSKIT